MKQIFAFMLLAAVVLPQTAAASLDYAAWIPWWQDTAGVKSATKHIKDLDIVYPFVYEVKSDGSLVDKGGLTDSNWKKFIKLADRKKVEVIPTVAWFDGQAIDAVLSDKKKRAAHIDEIVEMVEKGKYDGVDIDYESKLSATIDNFSLFLKELKKELGDKYLTCTLEARTPADSLYRDVPKVINYANDYTEIAKYCDWVEIMAYDQQRADLKLNSSKKGEPYVPVSDVDWVEKVIKLALKDIPAEKIMLGVPTYGRAWDLTVEPDWYKEYKNVAAINLPDAERLAKKYKVEPGRNQAGELSFSYFPEDSAFRILEVLPVPKGTRPGFENAARALLFANATGMPVTVRIAWYSDAKAIEDKIDLAEKYDLKGVAIFKVDGEEAGDIWDAI
ncbi:hypothetical protein KC722_02625, partial [Candidatus Kaiserbacteria bacterium]|nr:hypothetical protein [Candidatus Kaiserbacteria bacterium]MCB9811990.1 hypothetical protein [Candidatus Nomurabacteria bacterium]